MVTGCTFSLERMSSVVRLETSIVHYTRQPLTTTLQSPTPNNTMSNTEERAEMSQIRQQHIPAMIGNLSLLQTLIPPNNQLSGIPAEIGNLFRNQSPRITNEILTRLSITPGNLSLREHRGTIATLQRYNRRCSAFKPIRITNPSSPAAPFKSRLYAIAEVDETQQEDNTQ